MKRKINNNCISFIASFFLVSLLCGITVGDEQQKVAAGPPAFPKADIVAMAPMRDGVKLETHILLPERDGPFPAILTRTSYKDGIIPWGAYGFQRNLDAGYAVVWQNIRGVGESEGVFHYVANDRNDGYDTVEWIAAQPWSDGNVGMDGGSYLGMTQLSAAATAPPHLKAIIPVVTVEGMFRTLPYMGGIPVRHHMLSWLKLVTADKRSDLDASFANPDYVLSDPVWEERLTSRPLIDAGNGYLEADRIDEWKALFVNDEIDSPFWQARQNSSEEYRNMDVPVLLIDGTFNPAEGSLAVWKNLEAYAPKPQQRHIIVGPWTHGQTRFGGVSENGPRSWGDAADIDIHGLRLAFFDRYLKGIPASMPLPQRARIFVTGSNEWREFDTLPVPGREDTKVFFSSQGGANSSSGDGRLNFTAASGPADSAVADPENPIVSKTQLSTGISYYQETEARDDLLVYTSEPLEKPLTIIGEPMLTLSVSTDTKDADVIVRFTEVFPDGRSLGLGFGGTLRLRYRDGFDKQRMMRPGKVYQVEIPLSFIAHTIPAGHRIRIDIQGSEYPLLDPNPNTGEPIATAVKMQKATLSIHHDKKHPSFISIPVVE